LRTSLTIKTDVHKTLITFIFNFQLLFIRNSVNRKLNIILQLVFGAEENSGSALREIRRNKSLVCSRFLKISALIQEENPLFCFKEAECLDQ